MKVQAVKGFKDVLPTQSAAWQALEAQLAHLMDAYAYQQIRLPILEQTTLFARAIGDGTDIVDKEMFTFNDRGTPPESLTLRPEGTAGAVRAVLEHNLTRGDTPRLWYIGPMFRYENVQKGRYRQFHQFGVEVFGIATPDAEAELIAMTARLWRQLGIDYHANGAVELQINSLGQPAARQAYRQALVDYLQQHFASLDTDSQQRLTKNPLRILDSKNPETQTILAYAPDLLDFLDDESRTHFEQLQGYLHALEIPYKVNSRLVRGLDYYNRTVFEWVTTALGAQGTVCAGGRYDGLVGQLQGKPDQVVPAVGFALGMERILLLQETLQGTQNASGCDLFIASEPALHQQAMQLAEQLRTAMPSLKVRLGNVGSFKSQLKKADQAQANCVVLLGEQEQQQAIYTIKQLATGIQQQLEQSNLISWLSQHFNFENQRDLV